ncbi:TRM32 protein [Spatholobus suberectus]|nr:TRM32 protein [Spatholobus suberectus]
MGKRFCEKECALSNGNCNSSHHTHPGRVWGILHVMKYHHWRHVKRRLTHKRHGGGRPDSRAEIPGTSGDSGVHSMPEHYKPHTALSNVKEKLVHSPPPAKLSIKSRIRSLLHEDIYRRKGRHKRSSTCPAKSQLTRADSVHNLEFDPLSELLLTVESPEPVLETFQNHLAAGTLDVLSPVFSEKPIANNDKCVDCGTMFSSDILEHSKIHKHLSSPCQGGPEEKLMNAQILTTDASPHLFKDFLDALDVINTNKDFLLEYIQDRGSPLPLHQQSFNGKSRRAKSLSFPVSASSSGNQDSDPGQLINQMVDDWFNAEEEKLQIQSNKQNASMHESAEDLHQQSIPPGSSHQWGERDYNSSSVSSQVPNNMKTRHFRDLRKKMKHIIEEGRNEKYRITMDAILDKIPSGKKLTKNVKKLIHDQSKDPTINGESEDSATSGVGSRLSSNSFNKSQPLSMRNSSLKDSVGRYSQLYQTCFNSENKYPKTENLRLRTEERNSMLKTPKSFKRFLSMPNLKSYFHQNEEPSVILSPQNSIKKSGDRTSSTNVIDQQQRRFDHSDDSKNKNFPPTLTDNTNQESSLNAEQKQLLVRSASKSGLDFSNETNADKNIGIESLGNLRDIEHDIGAETESTTMPAEANSVFSSDTSFLDVTFDLENLNILEEESDSELKSGQDDGLDNTAEQQEAKDHPEVVENFQKLGTVSKRFNYEIPCIEVDASNEAAFNYVRKVLELSGFTGHDSLGIWYSDNLPVDPSVFEELEGCLLLDPDCSGNSGEDGECNHLLLFDIINEGLWEIFGRSYNYYPRPLSSLSHVHPLPAGENVLHKVWTLISWYLNSTTELYPSLDYYVSKDLAKYDGWMNLQFDSECVGLELDDLIFDDLLEEIFCA